VNCAACGFANAANARFCAGCGKPLDDPAAVPEAGERRQLTVLMCDLVGSTALSRALDPEDLLALLSEYSGLGGGRAP
jgi:class 3 adenylate cyclase